MIILKGSWFSALEDKKGKLAGILSNPPYIPSSHISTLQAEVGQYEPRNALDGGHEGTNDLATICRGAAWALQSDGCIILEVSFFLSLSCLVGANSHCLLTHHPQSLFADMPSRPPSWTPQPLCTCSC